MNTTRIRGDLHIDKCALPDAAGQGFAEYIIKSGHKFDNELEIDLRNIPAKLLISVFFGSFFAVLHEHSPLAQEAIGRIQWITDHEFQSKNIARWTAPFTSGPCITKGIRKLKRPESLTIGLPPASGSGPVMNVVSHRNEESYSVPISAEAAEVLIAWGIPHEG